MINKIEKYSYAILLAMGFLTIVNAAVLTTKVGSEITIHNNTSSNQSIVGVRFDSKDSITRFSNWPASDMIKENYDGIQVYEFWSDGSSWDFGMINLNAGETFSDNLLEWGAEIDGVKYLEPLFSKGYCNEPVLYELAEAITLEELKASLITNEYYDATHRYEKADVLGAKGGIHSAGFWDSYLGETQMQFAIPLDSFSVNNTMILWEERRVPTMSFMTLAMGQELFGVDQQYLFSMSLKESYFGTSFYRGLNSSVIYAPFDFEMTSFNEASKTYPKFFPIDTSKGESIESKFGESRDIEVISHPKMVSSWFGASIVNWQYYDMLAKTPSLGFKAVMENSPDSLIGICMMLPMYNRGFLSNVIDPFRNMTIERSHQVKCDDINNGFGEYKSQILATAEVFSKAGIEIKANKSSTNPQVLDRWITRAELKEFYFGRDTSGNDPWVAETRDGGLLNHFNLNIGEREDLWKELDSAFKLQEVKWGSMNKISLRYDWISNLRIAKKFLDVNRDLGGLTGGSMGIWNSFHANDSVFMPNATEDNRFPFVKIDSLVQDQGSLIVNVSTHDNRMNDQGVAKIEWTTQKNWTEFKSTHTIPTNSDVKNRNYEIIFNPIEIAAFKAEELDNNNPLDLYVRTVDSCGNAVVTKSPAFLKDVIVDIRGNSTMSQDGVFTEALGFEVYNTRGEAQGNFPSLYDPSFQNLNVGRYFLVQKGASKIWFQR